MQTFSDFINRRFGYNENTDQNQQVVPEETIKKSMELEKIIHLILDNPNYFKKFFETVKEFVYEYMANLGFIPVENIGNINHPITHELIQQDILFLNKNYDNSLAI